MFSNLFLTEGGYPHKPRKPDMQKYIRTKTMAAQPVNRTNCNMYRGWDLPKDENGLDEGDLPEYLDGGKPDHPQHDGYISWSPAEQFEAAYRKTSGLASGLAVEAMKKGAKIARTGWNGAGMSVYYVPAANCKATTLVALATWCTTGMVPYRACMALKTADGAVAVAVATWAPSGSDCLADDWVLVS